MSDDEHRLLAVQAVALRGYLERLRERTPATAAEFRFGTDIADTVLFNLLQAVQLVIDVAHRACTRKRLGLPSSQADAFEKLRDKGLIDPGLASRLSDATRFRNLIVHSYSKLDASRVHAIALDAGADLLAFMEAMRNALPPGA